jgi:release factor glutamine methyltransferase
MHDPRLSASDMRREPRVWRYGVGGAELWQWRQQAQTAAIAAQIPPMEVDWLLRFLADLDALALRLESFRDRPAVACACTLVDLDALWQRRLRDRVPVQYLLGQAPWRDFILQVSPAVLIPRPETECLIDIVSATQPPSASSANWADLGTGSGAIALGLATTFPNAQIHAVDVSPEALAIAQVNSQHYGLSDRIHFYNGRWFEPLTALQGQLTGLVSNPPYIPSATVLELQPEVQHHEPHLALDGGSDGLDCVRHLIETAPAYLVPGGIWLVELMLGQATQVAALLHQQGQYNQIEIHADLAGVERFVLARRTNS